MSLNKYIIHESSASRGDVSVTFPDIDSRIVIGQVKEEHRDVFYHWVSKKAVAHGARYQFVSQSAFPPGERTRSSAEYVLKAQTGFAAATSEH